jgi:gliding motility-associated-like protein
MFKQIYFFIGIIASVLFTLDVNGQACNNPVTTAYNNNNGQDGIMFTVHANRNVVIDSFDHNYAAGTLSQILIYYKLGTATGFQTTPGAWTLLGTANNVTSAGINNPTTIPINVNLTMLKHQTVAFYITTNGGTNPIARYTNGTNVCDSISGNGEVVVESGYGKDYPFGATFTTRRFNGRVYYHCITANTGIVGNFSFCNATSGNQETYYLNPPIEGDIYWTLPAGMTQVSSGNNDTITVQFNGGAINGELCAAFFGCDGDTSGFYCEEIIANPPNADAGPDTGICAQPYQLQANNGANGFWQVISGSGTFANANQYDTEVSGLSQGQNVFRWTIGGNGCPVSSDDVIITLLPQAVANFSFSNVCDDDAMSLSSTSYALGGSIVDWDWDVDGDNSSDYSTNGVSHVFGDTGNYQCRLIVESNGGCVDTVTKTVRVHPNPVADFTFIPECEETPTPFTDQSTIGTGQITDWLWNFGDGSTSALQNDSHTYQTDGVYIASLLVTSPFGCDDWFTDSIEVFTIPNVDFDAPFVCQNDTVSVTDLSTSLEGNIIYWEWNFGDGTPIIYSQNTTHNYVLHGEYDIELLVGTDKGCTNSLALPYKSYPVPIPEYVRTFECEKQVMRFRDSSLLDPIFNSYLVKWDWEFGDGNVASNESVGNFYQAPGNYKLLLTPYTNHGCHQTSETDVLVRPKPRANILVKNDQICAGSVINFQDETYFDYTYDTTGVVDWRWDFGDGNSSKVKDPSNIYATGGNYKTKLRVETSFNCVDSTEITTVVFHNPKANFDFDSIVGCSPMCVTFMDKSRVLSGDSLVYKWDFGDGNSTDEVNPTHCFEVEDGTEPAVFKPSVQVTTVNGCSAQKVTTDSILVYPNPISDFNSNYLETTMLKPVFEFYNTSLGGTDWSWDFGDSTYSDEMNPIAHDYYLVGPGYYDVQLRTNTEFGCTDLVSKTIRVRPHQALYIPKSFTPNADGINDRFEVKGEDLVFIGLTVYDRWGKQVFYGENDDASWDGYENGKMSPLGTYLYILDYRLNGGIKQRTQGSLFISRTDNE